MCTKRKFKEKSVQPCRKGELGKKVCYSHLDGRNEVRNLAQQCVIQKFMKYGYCDTSLLCFTHLCYLCQSLPFRLTRCSGRSCSGGCCSCDWAIVNRTIWIAVTITVHHAIGIHSSGTPKSPIISILSSASIKLSEFLIVIFIWKWEYTRSVPVSSWPGARHCSMDSMYHPSTQKD